MKAQSALNYILTHHPQLTILFYNICVMILKRETGSPIFEIKDRCIKILKIPDSFRLQRYQKAHLSLVTQ